ncbi:MAG: VanZ family protein [Phycisphaerae bacterium]|nr:VanZ family protein [Phycisphaerae bacterium]
MIDKSKQDKITINLRWLTIAFAIALVIATHIPKKMMTESMLTIITWDKLLHMGAYAILAWLIFVSFAITDVFKLKISILFALAIFGAIDEYTQQFVNRSPGIDDWSADFIGAASVLVFIRKKH